MFHSLSIPSRAALLFVFLSRLVSAETNTPSVLEPEGSLSLADAIALTLARSPRLEASRWEVRIHEAAAIQAAARPNPEISLDVENAFGSSEFSDLQSAEETLSIGQTIELGRKRRHRIDLAHQDIEVATQGELVEKARVLNALAKAYYETVAAQQALIFAKEHLQMQSQLADVQSARLKAGKISESEVENGKAALALARIEVDTVSSELAQARRNLASHWGSSEARFNEVAHTLDTGTLPSKQSFQEHLQNNPFLGYASILVDRQDHSVALERASRVSDLTAGIGGRRFEASGDTALVLQVSIPLPLFNRNRGNIEKARAEAGKARAERESARAQLEASFAACYENLATAHREAEAITRAVLPSAVRGYEYANEGYQLGKYSYFELKAAQSVLIESRQKLAGAQLRFHQAKADLEALVGRMF